METGQQNTLNDMISDSVQVLVYIQVDTFVLLPHWQNLADLVFRAFIESVLSFCLVSWFGNLSLKNRNRLNQTVKWSRRLIGESQSNPESLHTGQLQRTVRSTLTESSHPLHSDFRVSGLDIRIKYESVKPSDTRTALFQHYTSDDDSWWQLWWFKNSVLFIDYLLILALLNLAFPFTLFLLMAHFISVLFLPIMFFRLVVYSFFLISFYLPCLLPFLYWALLSLYYVKSCFSRPGCADCVCLCVKRRPSHSLYTKSINKV